MRNKRIMRILAVKHTWFDATTCIIPEVEKETGLKVIIDYIHDEWEMYRQSKERITSEASDYDLFMVDSIWVFEYEKLGMLECLDQYVAEDNLPEDYDFEDLISPYVDHFCRVHDRLYCLPLAGHTNFLAYRRDLLGEKRLKVPEDQEELLNCARVLHTDDMSGITLRGKGFELAYTFMLFLYPNGGKVLDDTCRPCLDSVEALETLRYLKELWQYTPRAILDYSFPDMAADFMEGRAALYNDASVGAILSHNCPVKNDIGYALPPAGKEIKTSVAGWGLGIPRAAGHKQEAFSYLLAATGRRNAHRIFLRGRDPIRYSTLKDPELRRAYPFLKTVEACLQHASPWFRPPVPELAGVLSMLGDSIAKVLRGEYRAAQGLREAQSKISEYLVEAGL
jgi:ABC-type glycerol-3-phosphate transport system substrate-binding protein